MEQQVAYQAPTQAELKELFGDKLQEQGISVNSDDVDEFVSLLNEASKATKEHSIQFG